MNRFFQIALFLTALNATIYAQNIIDGDSSFETGPSWLVASSYNGAASWQIDYQAPPVKGSKSLKINFPGKGDWTHSRLFPLKDGEYTFSLYAKSSRDKVAGWLGIWRPWDSSLRKSINIGRNWKRYSVTGKIKGGNCWLCFGAKEACQVWVDAWQLEKGPELTEYAPKGRVCVGLSLPFENDRIFYKGETVPVKLTISGAKDQSNDLSFELEIKDTFGNTVFKKGNFVKMRYFLNQEKMVFILQKLR
jgi:hypothetical protein